MAEDRQNVTIHISSGSIIRVLLFIALFWLVITLRQIVMVLLAAVVIASAIEPGAVWLVKHRFPRVLGVILIYIVLILFFAGIFYFILPPLFGDMLSLLNTLPHYFDYSVLGGQTVFTGFESTIQTLTGALPLKDAVTQFGSTFAATSPAAIFGTAATIFGGFSSFLIIIVLSFYLSAQPNGVEKFLLLVTPREKENYVIGLWRRTQRKIGLWLQGQFLLGIFMGILVFIALSIVGIRHALLLGVLSGLFEIIPIFGSILGAIPGIAIALLDGGLTLGLLVAGLYTAIQQFESNVMYPLVVKKIIGIPPLVVILALIIGFSLGGFLGAILAVPMATALLEYVDDIQSKRAADKAEEATEVSSVVV